MNQPNQPNPTNQPTPQKTKTNPKKILLLLLLLTTAILIYTQLLADTLTLQNLTNKETQLRQYQTNHTTTFLTIAFLTYLLTTALSLPGALILTITLGWLLASTPQGINWTGYTIALLTISLASTAGATIAFLLSRYLLRETITHKFHNHLQTFNQALQHQGPFYLLTLRLIFIIPFFIINLVMGLTTLRTWTFWWVSQLGMLPATAAYTYAGAALPTLQTLQQKGTTSILTPQLLTALLLLALLPITTKKTITHIKNKKKQKPNPTPTNQPNQPTKPTPPKSNQPNQTKPQPNQKPN